MLIVAGDIDQLWARNSFSTEKSRCYFKWQKGSNNILRRDKSFAGLAVPDHKSINTGTLANILDDAGISVNEFIHLAK